MRSMAVIVMLESNQLRLQIRRCPEQRSIEVLAPNCADQAPYERVPKRYIWNRLDFRHLEYSKIGLPLVESIERVVIRTEIFW